MGKRMMGLVLTISMSGCTTYAPSVPENYSGPVAPVEDSVTIHSNTKADLFYVEKVNGRKIRDSLTATRDANYGRGFYMEPVNLDRKIPARQCTLTISARTVYAAPILAMSNDVYEVSGDVTFTPKPNRRYIVNGELGESYSAVWIEDKSTERIVTDKVEVHGSAEVGFFGN